MTAQDKGWCAVLAPSLIVWSM